MYTDNKEIIEKNPHRVRAYKSTPIKELTKTRIHNKKLYGKVSTHTHTNAINHTRMKYYKKKKHKKNG